MADGDDTAGQPAADVTPAIELVYGRAVLINPSDGEQQVRLKLGPNGGVAKLARNATLAFEVERKHVPGQDPRETAAPVEIRLFAPDGGVVWTDAAGEKAVDKASRWTLTETGASEIAADSSPPEWIDHEPIVQLSEQRFGAPVIESTLVSNRAGRESTARIVPGQWPQGGEVVGGAEQHSCWFVPTVYRCAARFGAEGELEDPY